MNRAQKITLAVILTTLRDQCKELETLSEEVNSDKEATNISQAAARVNDAIYELEKIGYKIL